MPSLQDQPELVDAHRAELLDTEAAAALPWCPYTASTLATMRARKVGPPFVKAGPGPRARVLYDVHALRLWLRSRYRVIDPTKPEAG